MKHPASALPLRQGMGDAINPGRAAHPWSVNGPNRPIAS
jgi:hypothetical protein